MEKGLSSSGVRDVSGFGAATNCFTNPQSGTLGMSNCGICRS